MLRNEASGEEANTSINWEERRREKRIACDKSGYIDCIQRRKRLTIDIVDESDGGFGFKSFEDLPIGSDWEIVVDKDNPYAAVPVVRIRWTKPIEGGQYRVGCEVI